jgi:hypothetical protein
MRGEKQIDVEYNNNTTPCGGTQDLEFFQP